MPETNRPDLAWLGRHVQVSIDRPLGSLHPVHGHVHPVNYGFIPGTMADDGSEVDAYLLGPTEAVASGAGVVVAIVHRLDDVEDKLLVLADGHSPIRSDDLMGLVDFQERWYDTRLITAEPPA
ncbi:MAG TPA: inorganic diphosphatase [Acidimicrobiales bacterium]|nr:inorganic diphosphatase [Acidimicrobiales bacterium]